jgi:hypothetical protein
MALCNTIPNKIYVHTFIFYNMNGKVVLKVTRDFEFKSKIICVTGFIQNNFCNIMAGIQRIFRKKYVLEKYILKILKTMYLFLS